MRLKQRVWFVTPLGLLSVLLACGGGGDGGRTGGTVTPPTRTPTVTSIEPRLGPAAGGTAVTVTGSSFQAGDTVLIGGVAATNTTVVGSTTITATTAARAAGTVEVAVRTNTGATGPPLANAFSYWTLTADAGGPYLVNDHTQALTVSATGSRGVPFAITRYSWDCGQSTPRIPDNCVMANSTNPTPQWRYFRTTAGAGRQADYTIRLSVFNSEGHRADATARVTVTNTY